MDEAFQILEGHYQVWCDGDLHELGPGAMAMIPKGTPDAFRCLGPGHGRMLTTVVPGGLDDFFIEVEVRGFKLPADLRQLMELGARYGHEFVGPRSATDRSLADEFLAGCPAATPVTLRSPARTVAGRA